MDNFINFFQSNKINIFDIVVAIIILFNLISSLKKGFVLSLIYFLKWIIAFIVAKFSIPYALPYVNEIIENDHIIAVVGPCDSLFNFSKRFVTASSISASFAFEFFCFNSFTASSLNCL